ncbi:aminoglycoside phosphotransferase family protein [Streptomyces roseifaciens]|uniref:aminoglycoside phosphotransferase family protein n=1 Tax=Streptomyces roseifaciens TaxID=1488406 RepID=UPI0007180895|nr:aminoglycoside phosphotransferase family protein [Streptomyces roseifaciens]
MPTADTPSPALTAAERAEHAVGLATRAGRGLGLQSDEPRVLHNVFNVLVHLAPHPVVVRVPSLAAGPLAEQAAKQRRELAVAGWLADRGAPVVGPSPLVPREPVEIDGRSLTFWEFVDETDPLSAVTDPAALQERFVEQTGWAAELHALLAEYPGDDLPVLAPVVPAVGLTLDTLAENPHPLLTPAELDRARKEYAVLETLVQDLPAHFPGTRLQTLHGDSPAYNLLRTAGGHLFSDFEDATRGPVEWDLTLVGPLGIAEYERASGTQVNRALLDVMETARFLQIVGALAFASLKPDLAPMLEPAIDQWRARTPLSPENLG